MGEDNQLRAFNTDGSSAWTFNFPGSPTSYIFDMNVGDGDNDGYYDTIFIADRDYSGFRVFNRTGGSLWNSSDIGSYAYVIEVGDLDLDGYEDDFVGSIRFNNGTYGIVAYNTSDGQNWTQMWNQTGAGEAFEIKISDLIDNKRYVAWVDYGGGRARVVYSNNGSYVWTPGSDRGTAFAITFFDSDRDGKKDEVAMTTSSPTVYVYDETGAESTLTASSSYGYEIIGTDLDNDGYEDDLILPASNNRIRGIDSSDNLLFLYTALFNSNCRRNRLCF